MPGVGVLDMNDQPIKKKLEKFAKSNPALVKRALDQLVADQDLVSVGNSTEPFKVIDDDHDGGEHEESHMRNHWFTKGSGNWPDEDVGKIIRPALINAFARVMALNASSKELKVNIQLGTQSYPKARMFAYGGPDPDKPNAPYAVFYLFLPMPSTSAGS